MKFIYMKKGKDERTLHNIKKVSWHSAVNNGNTVMVYRANHNVLSFDIQDLVYFEVGDANGL